MLELEAEGLVVLEIEGWVVCEIVHMGFFAECPADRDFCVLAVIFGWIQAHEAEPVFRMHTLQLRFEIVLDCQGHMVEQFQDVLLAGMVLVF